MQPSSHEEHGGGRSGPDPARSPGVLTLPGGPVRVGLGRPSIFHIRRASVKSAARVHSGFLILVAVILVVLSHGIQDTTGLSPGDEGYLWYGSLRTAAGDVPIRDFRSYDPGRYYWCAAFSHLFGDGLLGLRRSSAAFQVVGLLCGLLALTRAVGSRPFLLLAGICLTLWMQPVYKLFEPAIALIAVWVGVRLLEKPSRTRLFVSGVFVGLAAFVGRNLGLYAFLAFAALLLYLRFKMRAVPLWRSSAVWVGGVLAGLSPLWAMMGLIPGFARSWMESVIFLYARGGANLGVPVPWPWRVVHSGTALDMLIRVSTGMSFLLVPIFLGVLLILRVRAPKDRKAAGHLLTACVFVGLPYAHHAWSRADLTHLAGAIHPILIGLVTVAAASKHRFRWAVPAVLLIVSTLPGAFYGIPAFHRLSSSAKRYVRADIRGDSMWINHRHARLVNDVARVLERNVPSEESLLIATHSAILYPLLGRTAPIWDPYLLWPHSEKKQIEMIAELERNHTRWVLTSRYTLDGRSDLAPGARNPILWAYLMREFEPVSLPPLDSARTLLVRKGSGEAGAEIE